MGSALLSGWLAKGAAAEGIFVVEPHEASRQALLAAHPGVGVLAGAGDLPDVAPRAIVLAIKPQNFEASLPAYRGLVRPGVLVLSIAAGIVIETMERLLGDAAVIRAMPNTPAAVGAGMTALIGNRHVAAADRALAQRLLAAVGRVVWLENEGQMDAVTAVSGSGPAYVFHLVEALAKAAEAQGLPLELATALARQTVVGSGALLAADPADAATLRRNVTSPGGTTAAALDVLMGEDALTRLMTEAVTAAARRSRELAGR
jgi:pyrroline-5-carboxylate reductase